MAEYVGLDVSKEETAFCMKNAEAHATDGPRVPGQGRAGLAGSSVHPPGRIGAHGSRARSLGTKVRQPRSWHLLADALRGALGRIG